MRLLSVETLKFTNFIDSQVPSYAIASHRWIAGTETGLEEVEQRRGTSTAGYRKVQAFVDYVKGHMPLVKWLWIDTCCIDQKSSQEVSEAINSMFRWYAEAEVCLAYMDDVAADMVGFESSIWFRRGWTLQELLAPGVVIFLSRDWQVIGHKGHGGRGRSGISMETGLSREKTVAAITQIPEPILHDYEHGRYLNAEKKMQWMTHRNTTREEDMSYCLLGLLGVSMNIRYGDGREKTRARLMHKVVRGIAPPTSVTDKYRVPFSLKGIPVADYFVPRNADMQHLTLFFAPGSAVQRQRVFIVHGMGGIGKTQLCAEFARTHQDHFNAVFWLDGSSKDSLRRAMEAATLRLPVTQDTQARETLGTDENTTQLSERFLLWLSMADNKDWLLIIDNVDREWQSGASDPQAYDYRDFLPLGDHGNVIVTTRLARLRRPRACLGLGSVDDDLAREFIESAAGQPVQDVEILLPKLSGLPLALVQAGAFLGATGMTTADYIRSYEDTWTELMQYQNQFPLQEYAERSVLTTWKMSYDQIKSSNAQAAKLLDLWAFLYHGDLWIEIIQEVMDSDSHYSKYIGKIFPHATKLSLQHSVGILTQYSMVTAEPGSGSRSIHPVLQTWCLHNIETSGVIQERLVGALHLVAGVVFAGNITFKDRALRLAAHARAVGRRVKNSCESKVVGASCTMIGSFLSKWESSDEVEMLLLQAVRHFENTCGPEDELTAIALTRLGKLYREQCKAQDSLHVFQKALRALEKAGDPDNELMLSTFNDVGLLFVDLGNLEDAKKLFSASLRGYRRVFGPNCKAALHVIHSFGLLYLTQGKLQDAEFCFDYALRGFMLEQDPLPALITLNSLVDLLQEQGDLREAEEMHRAALHYNEEVWGMEHESSLKTLIGFGHLRRAQGKNQEAVEIYRRALRGIRNLPYSPGDEVKALEEAISTLQVNVSLADPLASSDN